MLDQQPADDRPGGGGDADRATPDADGHVELVGGEGGPQQSQRGGLQQRPEQALQHPEGDDQLDAVGEADRRRGRGEADRADQEGGAVPEPVADLARGDQEDGQGQQVAVGHPLDAGERGVQVGLDGGVGDGHDRAVQRHHHHPDGDGQQRQPGVAAQSGPAVGYPLRPVPDRLGDALVHGAVPPCRTPEADYVSS